MTDPKVTFLQNAALVKAQLQSLSDASSDAQSNTSNLSESVISAWQAKGVLTESDAAAIRQQMPEPQGEAINTQAMVNMIAAMEEIVQGLSSGGQGFSLSEISAQPASVISAGNPGQFYVQGTAYLWLCVRANFWVKLAMG